MPSKRTAPQNVPRTPRPAAGGSDDLARIWTLTRDERIAAAARGDFNLPQICHWASRAGATEVPIINNEYAYIVAHLADLDPD